ncbi:hypothetical protein GCM10007887_38070 [Methylobacterium haplocladii]|uniref:Uncharacterized protein n=1 Tax=Methylobacterium haplocladii TaxID=1176176 RepID=A0A512IVX9_9HYPH|nr:hypothetical protein MHA02_42480 [Methylobacterium haplocladii]GLS61113.1 hypothetical protein GCM10007887_38070 [Methylobacterium haplocladii]
MLLFIEIVRSYGGTLAGLEPFVELSDYGDPDRLTWGWKAWQWLANENSKNC